MDLFGGARPPSGAFSAGPESAAAQAMGALAFAASGAAPPDAPAGWRPLPDWRAPADPPGAPPPADPFAPPARLSAPPWMMPPHAFQHSAPQQPLPPLARPFLDPFDPFAAPHSYAPPERPYYQPYSSYPPYQPAPRTQRPPDPYPPQPQPQQQQQGYPPPPPNPHDPFAWYPTQNHRDPNRPGKKYACPKCGKVYGTLGNMNRHSRVHDEDPRSRHYCPIPGCGKSFVRVDNMKTHHKSHLRRINGGGGDDDDVG
ncbi:hypothetical protein DFJ74DRAFT_695374 [Hyaloraphidium curvatum]|nr:hypothetical protein DFJ74DRAFT_695374 [Hyaloraphidium curvatum]